MGFPYELMDLSRHLKQERLFVTSEREQLQTLNEQVAKTAEKLYHLSWITRQQKQTLDHLMRADKDATPEKCCQRANNLEHVNFVDGYKNLSYHESKVGEFLKMFRENPKVVATCLVQSEQANMETMQKIARVIVTSIYGNSVMPTDEAYVIQLLKCLLDRQIARSDNPRRLLRKGSCAFNVIFKLLNENMFSAKLFLTAALHKPIMQLLMEDEWFYDIDPERALCRFPPQEQAKRFGQPGSDEFQQKTRQYREVTSNKLVLLAERFISSIKNNMYCFPQSLSWLVHQLYHTVTKAGRVEVPEARAMCADLIFALFICPAICDPEPFGITSDTPISYIARHNLMQVAQIMQILALSTWDEIDPKTRDLYGKFEKGCLSSLLDAMLESASPDQTPHHPHLQGIARSAVLITLPELLQLLTFLRNLSGTMEEGSSERKYLENLLSNVPQVAALQALQATPSSTPQPTPPGTPPVGKKHKSRPSAKRLMLNPELLLDSVTGGGEDEEGISQSEAPPDDVLVISLGVINDCPGMLSEQKVLDQDCKQRKVRYNNYIPGEEESVSGEIQLHEKRTRFSLSHDQDSIATSDNLEAISEAASSHSVGSDIDNENDNLSDMVSANVSGRGTPNISGRDTPLSQAESQAESVDDRTEKRPADLPVIVQKRNREDVTDRFGKFEIKQEIDRDEIKSTVSDTWSTDVLASDSEPPEQNQLERLEEVAEEMARHNLLGGPLAEARAFLPLHNVSELSETASDAWSTDVLASDTSERQADRLMELDQDEVASVSSRSQGPEDSEAGDAQESTDDTPNGPGSQSPAVPPGGASNSLDAPDNRNIGALSDLHSHQGAFMPPTFRSRPPLRPDRISDPTSNGQSFHAQHVNDRRAVSDIVGTFNHIEAHKNSYLSNQRVSASLKYAEGKVSSILQAFDPLASLTGEDELPQEMRKINDQAKSLSSQSNTRSQVSVSSSLVISPDQGIASPGSEHLQQPVPLTTPSPDRRDRDSGVPPTPQDGALVDHLLSNEMSGLKLMEQQNVNIDANRLSATINLFDPLMSESSTDPEPLADANSKVRPISEPPGVQIQRPLPISRLSYNESGARPKVPQPNPTSTPRISVQAIEPDANGLPSGPIFDHNITKKSSSEGLMDNVSSAFFELDNGMLGSNKRHSASSDLSTHSNDSLTKSRSSTESSCSSLVDLNASASSKTISFDNSSFSAEKEPVDEEKGQDSKKKSSFFKSFKERLSKGGKRKVTKPFEREDGKSGEPEKGGAGDAARSSNPEATGEDILSKYKTTPSKAEDPNESSDDILAKYRRQPVNIMADDQVNESQDKSDSRDDDEDSLPAFDASNLESCKAFLDAKRKLRLVLSTSDFHSLPAMATGNNEYGTNDKGESELVAFLKMQLAEAINLQDKHLIAQLHETIRCLKLFDNDSIRKLLKSLRDDYKSRSPYIMYLIRCRQGLLSSQAHIDRLLNRVHRDKTVCNKYFLSVFVRLFLEKKERHLMKFIANFQKLTVSDEKTDLVEKFMDDLARHMEQDQIWKAATESQMEEARLFIERNVMSHIYTHAMYPNGDGDILRDQILHEHMKKLSRIITPSHKEIRIPKMYHYECPWPAAQSEIYMINAYKTPKDKLQCVLRCSATIMNLLSMANEKSVPAADDFMPVLIFVLIKANPPSLLSTVQYVNSFYEKRLQGEEQYWWMQFSAAIEFIKTMVYHYND